MSESEGCQGGLRGYQPDLSLCLNPASLPPLWIRSRKTWCSPIGSETEAALLGSQVY